MDDVRVLDLRRVLVGLYCAQLLAGFGADVIKVEGPPSREPPLTATVAWAAA